MKNQFKRLFITHYLATKAASDESYQPSSLAASLAEEKADRAWDALMMAGLAGLESENKSENKLFW